MGVESSLANRLSLTAVLIEMASLRYTPAGIPALDLLLEHTSQQQEIGQIREVALKLKAIGFGTIAETLARQALGSTMEAHGFLTNTRNGKGVVFHIQDFKLI